ncbi:MAG: alpha/beta hydrolase [Phycisphaerales bacterium]
MQTSQRRRHPCATGSGVELLVLAFVFLRLVGCSGPTKLPVAPNVLRDGSGSQMLAEIPPDQHVVDMPIIFLTDRARVGEPDAPVSYGSKRSPSLAFGVATVSLDPVPTWDELLEASGSAADDHRYALTVRKIEELENFSVTAESFEFYDGNLRYRPEVKEAINRKIAEFTDLVRAGLAVTGHKDVYIYVHGVDNSFDDAIRRAAILWHYIGRQGVFVAYAWPAGWGGVFGYFYDRESGEFTVHHLRRFISEIAKIPEVERIHIIAHSRGCDVVTTALREINLECVARGQSTQKELKLETLVLAAADVDVDVFGQRLFMQNLAVVAKRFVVYSSSKDSAVGLADWLFSSNARLGTVSKRDVQPATQELLAQVPNVEFVQCVVSGFGTTHDYMFTNPGAMSDLILVLRDRKDPGVSNGRPLTPLGGAFWTLDNTYALPQEKAASH